MICQRMMLNNSNGGDIWRFTVNTEATTTGEKKTGIPFNLYEQNEVILTVDWGDNQTTILTPSDYGSSDAMASVHEYQTAGIYQIKISSKNWDKIKIGYTLTYTGSLTSNNQLSLKYFKESLVSLDSSLPEIQGSQELSSSGRTNRNGECYGVFYRCDFLSTIPTEFLSKHINNLITSYGYLFSGCISLSNIPRDLLYYNPDVIDIKSMLNSTSIGGVELDILSPNINSMNGFLSNSTSYSRIIHVKANTTTEATFNARAANMGLTVIGE